MYQKNLHYMQLYVHYVYGIIGNIRICNRTIALLLIGTYVRR